MLNSADHQKCIKGIFLPPLEPKAENCFSPNSFDWLIRIKTEVNNFGINFDFTVAMVTKMADKIGVKQRNCHFRPIKGFWRPTF